VYGSGVIWRRGLRLWRGWLDPDEHGLDAQRGYGDGV
jgi:hypothetical protein